MGSTRLFSSSSLWRWNGCVLAVGVLSLGFLSLFRSTCWAETRKPNVRETVRKTAHQLADGRPSEAIRHLESFADEGVRHPELSFNRAIAYWERAKSSSAETGDLGQAAAGFAEVLSSRPSDLDASRGLEEVQLSVSRSNAQAEKSSVGQPLGLLERALLALNPVVLVILGGLGSLLFLVGLLLRQTSSETRKVAGAISAGIGAVFLLPSFATAQARFFLFSDAEVAVVVAERAPVLDEAGRVQRRVDPLAESTLVYVKLGESGLLQLVGLGATGHLRVGQVRVVGPATR